VNELLERKKQKRLSWETAQGIYADLSRWPGASYYVKCANKKCGQVHGFYKTFDEARSKRLCPLCHSKDIAKLQKEVARVDEPEKPKRRAQAVVEALLAQ